MVGIGDRADRRAARGSRGPPGRRRSGRPRPRCCRSRLSARAPLNSWTPRRSSSSSRAAATSASLWGRTCWRLTIRVTLDPSELNMWTNSTPVTPEPTTTRCSGSSGGGYACRVVSTRSPSGTAQSGTRGRLPVETTTASALSSSSRRPSGPSLPRYAGPSRRASPRTSARLSEASKLLDGSLQPGADRRRCGRGGPRS